jgi:WD40 repeat protein
MVLPNFDNLKIARNVPFAGDLLSVVHVPDSEKLWIGSADHKLYSLDLTQPQPTLAGHAGHTSYVSGVVLAGKDLISASWDRKLIWWDTAKLQPARSVDAHQRWIRQLKFNPARQLLATVADDMVCKLWEAGTGQLVRELKGHEPRLPKYDYPSKLYAVDFTPDGAFVAAADEACRVLVWETETGREAARFEAPAFFKADWDRNNHPYGGLRCLAFAPDGQALALGGIQNTDVAIITGTAQVHLVDWKTGRVTQDLKGGKDMQYESLWFHPQGRWLLAAVGGTQKGAVLAVFDLEQKRLLKEVAAPGPLFGLTVDDKRDLCCTVGRGAVLRWGFSA